MIKRIVITVVALVSSTIGLAAAEAPTERVCVMERRIKSWRLVDDRQIFLYVQGHKHKYRVTFVGPCQNLKWATGIAVSRRVGLCLAPGDIILFKRSPWDRGGEECWIDRIEPVPFDESDKKAPVKRREEPAPRWTF